LERFDKSGEKKVTRFSSLAFDDFFQPFDNHLFVRFVESDVETMASKRSDFFRLSVVANANDWDCCLLDHVNDLIDSSSVALTHTVDFIHYHQVFHQRRGFMQTQ
jgi:hypothetical protein